MTLNAAASKRHAPAAWSRQAFKRVGRAVNGLPRHTAMAASLLVAFAPAQGKEWVYTPGPGQQMYADAPEGFAYGDSLRLNGWGTLVLNNRYRYEGGTTVDGGTLLIGNLGAIVGDVVNNGLLAFDKSFDDHFDAVISGYGGLQKRGTGTLTLRGDNRYLGDTTLLDGWLALGHPNAIVGSSAIVFAGGGLQYSASNINDFSFRVLQSATRTYRVDTDWQHVTWAAGLTSGAISKSGGGTLTLAGVNSYAGTTQINGGALAFTNAADQTLAGDITGSGSLVKLGAGTLTVTGLASYTGTTALNTGELVFDNAGDQALSGAISGSGRLVKAGHGTLTLSGSNSFSGGTTLLGGVLVLGHADAIGAIGAINFSPIGFAVGTLQYSSANQVDYSGRIAQSASSHYSVDTNGQGVTWATGLKAGALTKSGAGLLTLSGTNSYAGTTHIESGWLAFSSSGNQTLSGSVTGAGTLLKQNTGVLTLAGVNSYSGETFIEGGVIAFANQGDQTLSGSFNGPGGLTKRGAGTLTLAGAINHRGETFIEGGTLAVASTGRQSFVGALVGGGKLLKTGAGTLSLYDVDRYQGRITIEDGALEFVNSHDQTMRGGITGAGGLIKSGYGNLSLGGLNSFTGSTAIRDGTLAFTYGGHQTLSGDITGGGSLVKSGAGTLTITGRASYTGTTTIEDGALAFANSGDQTLSGRLSGHGSLLKSGAGTLAIGDIGDYSGSVSLQGGALAISTNNGTQSYRGHIKGSGTLIKAGPDTLHWGQAGAVFALDAGQHIAIQGGTFLVNISPTDWSRNQAGLLMAPGTTFKDAGSNVRVDALDGSGRIHSGFNSAGYEAFRFGVAGGSGSFSGVLADTDAANRHIGSFIKEGSGTQVLTGDNTFTGDLAIRGGQVQIGDGGTSGSLAARYISNEAELSFSRSDDSRYDGTIVGTGNLTKLGAGQLTLTQSKPTLFPGYSGLTSVRGGTLVLSNINNSRGHDISQGAVLELQVASGSRDGTVATQFTGQGTLRKTGAGQLLWGASAATFAMAAGSLIDVQAGSFVGGSSANEDWRLNQSALRVAAGARFDGVESNVRVDGLSGAGRISSGFAGAGYTGFTLGVAGGSGDFAGELADSGAGNLGHFVKVGGGTQTLRGASTFSGGFSIDGGTVALAGGSNRLPTGITVHIRNGATLDLGGTAQTLTGLGTVGDRVVGQLGAGSLFTSNGVFLQSGRVDATLQGGGSNFHQRLWIGGDAKATVLLNGSNDMVFSADHNQVIIGHGTTGAAGTVRVGNAHALAAATEGVQVFAGTLDLNGVTAVRARDLALLGGAASALVNSDTTRGASFLQTVILGTNQASRIGGAGDLALAGNVHGTGGIDKIGAGTLLLSGTNRYSGATTVHAGTIELTGSAIDSAFNVAAGATLSGHGALGALAVAGRLAPGRSPGQLNAGDTTFAGGGQYVWEISDATGPAGIGHDLLNVAGTLRIDASPDSRFTVSLVSLLADHTPGEAVNFDARINHSFTLVRTSGGVLDFSADEFAIDTSGFSHATYGGQWAVAVSGQDLSLNFTAAVSEPETYALMLAGLLLVGGVARRRRLAGTAGRG